MIFKSEFNGNHRVLLTQAQETELFEQYQKTKNPKIMEQICKAYFLIVVKVVKKMSGYGCDVDDLTSEGTIGLIKAIERFDISKGYRFATFAFTTISGYLYTYIVNNAHLVNVGTNAKNKKVFFKLKRKLEDLHDKAELTFTSNDGNSLPKFNSDDIKDICDTFNITELELANLYNIIIRSDISLQTVINDSQSDGKNELGDVIADTNPTHDVLFEEENTQKYYKRLLDKAMFDLPAREYDIYKSQMLLDDKMVLEELSRKYNLSKERIRQIREIVHLKVTNRIMNMVSKDEILSIMN